MGWQAEPSRSAPAWPGRPPGGNPATHWPIRPWGGKQGSVLSHHTWSRSASGSGCASSNASSDRTSRPMARRDRGNFFGEVKTRPAWCSTRAMACRWSSTKSTTFGDHGSPFAGRLRQEVAVGQSMQLGPFSRRDDVVPAMAKLSSDLRREVLVQQQLHRKIARSRSAAERSRSAIVACRSKMSSISAGNAA